MSLYARGSSLLSLGKTASMSVGTASGDTPVSRLTNGIMAQWVQAEEQTAAFAVDLGSAMVPDLVAVFNHNLDPVADVFVEGATDAAFAANVVTIAATVTTPHFWVDLRGTAASRRYWRLRVEGNTVAVRVGDLMVVQAETLRTHLWDYKDTKAYPEVGSVNDFGVLSRVKPGFAVRSREMTFTGDRTMVAQLRSIFRVMGLGPGPCVFVPVDGETDVWLLQSVETFPVEWEADGRYKVAIRVDEQSPGVGV